MSYTLLSPDATPEDYQQFSRGVARAPLAGASLAPGALAQVLPAAQDEQGNVRPALPGMLTSVYAGLGSVIPAVANYLIGSKVVPQAPGTDYAAQEYADTSRLAKSIIPAQNLAENDDERRMHEMMFSAGGMLSPIPAASFTNLPRIAKIAANIVVPTREAMPIAVPAMAAASGIADRMHEQQADPYERWLATAQNLQQQDQQPAQPQQVAVPVTNAAAPMTIGQAFGETSQGTTAAPTYGGEGEGDTSYLQWLARAGAVGLVTWAGMKHGGKILNPVIEALTDTKPITAAAHNANLAAIDAGVPGLQRGEAPLPGGAGTATTRWANNLYDSNRIIDAFTDATAPSETAAKTLEATTGTANSHAAMAHIIGAQMRSGVSEATGRVHPKLYDIVNNIGRMTDGQREVLNYGLHAADELDTRKVLWREAMAQQGAGNRVIPSLDDTQMRHNFYRVSSEDLQHAVNLMDNDPMTFGIRQQIKALQRSNIDEMVQRGRITPQDAANILRDRPNYISSVDAEGRLTQTFGERNPERWEGFQNIPNNAWDSVIQHYQAVYKDMAKNDWLRNVIDNGLRWQQADTSRARIFTEKTSPKMTDRVDPATGRITPQATVWEATAGPKERTINVFTRDGMKTYYVDNTQLWNAMKNNQTQLSAAMNGANWFRRMYQSGTTGVAGTVLAQRPFAVTNLLRNALQIPVDRSPGTIGGPIERALGVGRYRGVDPLFMAGSIAEAGRGAAAVIAKNLSNVMADVNNPLRRILGDQWANDASAWFEQRYQNSRAAGRHAEGIGGAGGAGTSDLSAAQLGEAQGMMSNPLATTQPTLWRNNGIVRLPGGPSATSSYINLRTLLRDLHQEVSDGANSYYYELNKNVIGKKRAAFEARRVIGDPSHGGAGELAQKLGQIVPYFNPTVQDTVRMMRNFRDNPFTYTMGTVQVLGTLALAQTFTAMLGGPDHVNHMEEGLSNQQRAANATFYHDPHDPLNNTQISLPQRWRWLYPMMLEMTATALGAWQAHSDEGIRERLIHTLADFFSHHVQNSTVTSQLHGLSDMTDIPLPVGSAAITAALGGQQLQPHLGTAIENYMHGQPLTAGFVRNPSEARVPGQTADSTFMSSNDGQWFQQTLGGLWGAAGKAIAQEAGATWQRIKEGHGIWGALTGLGSDAGQNFKDNAPWGNILWGNQAKLSAFNPMEESVSRALDAMRKTGSPADATSLGFASRGSNKPLAITDPKPAKDPTMQQMQGYVHQYYGSLAPIIKEISDIKKQKAQADSLGFSAGSKRDIGNNYSVQLNGAYAKLDAHIKLMNERLSQMTGKHVDIRSIDWDRGLDQFH